MSFPIFALKGNYGFRIVFSGSGSLSGGRAVVPRLGLAVAAAPSQSFRAGSWHGSGAWLPYHTPEGGLLAKRPAFVLLL